jgi:hypothetical protein
MEEDQQAEADAAAAQIETPRDWFFTFGMGHANAGCYIVFYGTHSAARAMMIENFGLKWCMQHASAEAAGVERWNLRRLEVL